MTDLTTIFNTSPRCKRINPLETIPMALENGVIYNVDYTDLKEAVNGALEAAWGTAVKEVYLSNRRGDQDHYDWVVTDNLYYGQGPQIHNLKSVLKKIAKVEKAFPECDLIAPARAICETVEPIITDMNKLKGMIVKGRKPSTDPRKTPERTIENTGTCAVCEQNVKLKGGKIVSHGYTVQWNQHQGNCEGVRYDPIEVSTEGAVARLVTLNTTLVSFKKTIENYETNPPKSFEEKVWTGFRSPDRIETHEQGTDKYNRILANKIRETERFAGWVQNDITRFEKKIANWEAKPLPGAKS